MKVYVLPPNEDWIVDRFVKEWNEDNTDISVSDPRSADVIWLLADWCYDRLPHWLYMTKNVLVTVHHIVPEKFGPRERVAFQLRDDITTAYHVPNEHTRDFISKLTRKPIHVIPYWANQRIWKKTGTRSELRKKYGLAENDYIIGSFQRDTEGAGIPNGIFLPKLEKGPDLLADAIIAFREKACDYFDVSVVLAGWRRQYIEKRLTDAGISFKSFDRPDQQTLNELYQTLDLYPVTARYEGGPQALIECGLLNVPVVSRDIGMAKQLLQHASIRDNVADAVPSVPRVESLLLPNGYEPYRKLLSELYRQLRVR